MQITKETYMLLRWWDNYDAMRKAEQEELQSNSDESSVVNLNEFSSENIADLLHKSSMRDSSSSIPKVGCEKKNTPPEI